MKKGRFLIFLILLTLGLGLVTPVAAQEGEGGCCSEQSNIYDAKTTLERRGVEYFEFPITSAEKCAQKEGVWNVGWTTVQSGLSWACEPPATNIERSLNLGASLPTQVEKKPAIEFIPNIEIPGLFSGKIIIGNETIGQYIAAFYMFFVALTGVLAVAMLVFSGFRRITAAGNASKLQEATDIMNAALSGVVLVLLSYLLLNLINPTLTRLAGVQLDPIEPILINLERTGEANKEASVCGVQVNPATGTLTNFDNVSAYDDIFKTVGLDKGVLPSLLKAVMLVESCGRPDAVGITAEGKTGGCGLMQVNPANNTFGSGCDGLITEAINEADSDPVKDAKLEIITRNITRGAEILDRYYRNTCPRTAQYRSGTVIQCEQEKSGCINGADRYAIAAYNAGNGANCHSNDCEGKTWWECEANDGFAETRKYINSIDAAHNTIRREGWVP